MSVLLLQVKGVCSLTQPSPVAQTGKNLPAMQETRVRSLGREDPLGGNGYPLQYSCLENPTDRGAWWATACEVAESDMPEQGACSGLPPPLANPSLDAWERASISGRKRGKRTDRCLLCSNKQLCLFLTASCRLIGAHYNTQKPPLLSLLQDRLFRMHLYREKCYSWLGGDGYLSKLKPGITHCTLQVLEIFLLKKKTKPFYSHC